MFNLSETSKVVNRSVVFIIGSKHGSARSITRYIIRFGTELNVKRVSNRCQAFFSRVIFNTKCGKSSRSELEAGVRDPSVNMPKPPFHSTSMSAKIRLSGRDLSPNLFGFLRIFASFYHSLCHSSRFRQHLGLLKHRLYCLLLFVGWIAELAKHTLYYHAELSSDVLAHRPIDGSGGAKQLRQRLM